MQAKAFHEKSWVSLFLLINKMRLLMSEHHHEHEDSSVCVKVAIFFVAVLAAIFFLGMIN